MTRACARKSYLYSAKRHRAKVIVPATVYLILATVYWLPRYWAATINWKGQIGHLQFIDSVGHYFTPAVQVNQIGLNQAESLWMLVAMVLLVVLLVLLVANGVIYFLQNKSKKIQEDCRRCSLISSKSAGCEEAGVEMFNWEEEKIESRWMGTRPRSWSRGGWGETKVYYQF